MNEDLQKKFIKKSQEVGISVDQSFELWKVVETAISKAREEEREKIVVKVIKHISQRIIDLDKQIENGKNIVAFEGYTADDVDWAAVNELKKIKELLTQDK